MDHGNAHHDGAHGGHAGHATHEALFVAGIGLNGANHVSFAYHGGGEHAGTGHNVNVFEAISPQGKITVNVPTKDNNGDVIRGYVCHISRHGRIDILSKFKALAIGYDLIRIDGKRPGFDPSNRLLYKILDFDAWKNAQEIVEGSVYDAATHGPRPKPNGWYPGATGSTSLIREYWQVGKRKNLLAKPEFDDQASTYLEISVITWSYYETGDFETKLEVRVISAPEWSPSTQQWGFRAKPFENHQRVAISTYKAMMEQLIQTKPDRASQLLRADMDKKFPPSPTTLEGTYAMSDAEVMERELEDVAQDATDDQVARDNQPTSAPAAPASDGNEDDSATADLEVELDD